MSDRNLCRHQRLDRVVNFGTQNQSDLPAGSAAIQRFASIAAISTRLDAAKVGQLRDPASLQLLLDALWLDFKDIARTARANALDEPGFGDPYRVPAEPTASQITTHADALLTLLEDDAGKDTPAGLGAKAAFRARFVKKLLPADFVEDLRADRTALDGKNAAKTADNLQGVQSTSEIEQLLLQGAKEVARLDAMMHNLYARVPAKLHARLAASRVERSPKRKKDDKKPDAPVTSPAP